MRRLETKRQKPAPTSPRRAGTGSDKLRSSMGGKCKSEARISKSETNSKGGGNDGFSLMGVGDCSKVWVYES